MVIGQTLNSQKYTPRASYGVSNVIIFYLFICLLVYLFIYLLSLFFFYFLFIF